MCGVSDVGGRVGAEVICFIGQNSVDPGSRTLNVSLNQVQKNSGVLPSLHLSCTMPWLLINFVVEILAARCKVLALLFFPRVV